MEPVIALSVAHYPEKPGACWEGTCEHELSIHWTNWTGKYLTDAGYSVALVVPGPLGQKVSDVNAIPNLAVALEIHFNAGGAPHASGCETLCYPESEKGIALAQAIQTRLQAVIGNRDRGVKEGWYRQDRPGVEDFPGDIDGDEVIDYFLRETHCPAVIIEPEFMHKLGTIERVKHTGPRAIADGIIAYLKQQ